jgi:dTDP-4-dehydrorhamnose reductase
MSWLVIGAFGQLGIALSRELSKRGISFNAWGSLDLDITVGLAVRDSISELSPKIIVNCAAWTDVDGAENNEKQAFMVNAYGAENIALAAKYSRAKLIHVSTDYVFSGVGNSPWHSDDLVNPQTAYGRTKAEGEKRVHALDSDNSTIVRTAWLYSPWGKNFAKTLTRFAINGEDEVRVVNDQIGQPTSAEDLAKQLVELGESNLSSGIYHGTNSGKATWFEFAEKIFELAGADVTRVVPVSSSEYSRPAKRPSYSVLSHETWGKTSIKPMRDWRIALEEAMPAIISAVKAE